MTNNKTLEEIEIKIRIPQESLDSLREQLLANGFRNTSQRSLELNTLFDFADRRLFSSGSAVRLRSYENREILTWKGPLRPDPELKIREEIETEVSSREAAVLILNRIGLKPVMEYSKFREKFNALVKDDVEVCIDETRVGSFIEIEGCREDINHITALMGLTSSDFVKATYIELLREEQAEIKDHNK